MHDLTVPSTAQATRWPFPRVVQCASRDFHLLQLFSSSWAITSVLCCQVVKDGSRHVWERCSKSSDIQRRLAHRSAADTKRLRPRSVSSSCMWAQPLSVWKRLKHYQLAASKRIEMQMNGEYRNEQLTTASHESVVSLRHTKKRRGCMYARTRLCPSSAHVRQSKTTMHL
eukprot:1326865-Amphidinium_carterae.2